MALDSRLVGRSNEQRNFLAAALRRVKIIRQEDSGNPSVSFQVNEKCNFVDTSEGWNTILLSYWFKLAAEWCIKFQINYSLNLIISQLGVLQKSLQWKFTVARSSRCMRFLHRLSELLLIQFVLAQRRMLQIPECKVVRHNALVISTIFHRSTNGY